MKNKKVINHILLGLFLVSLLIGLIAGCVTATTSPIGEPWNSQHDGGIIAISFIIPWLISIIFAQAYWHRWSVNL